MPIYFSWLAFKAPSRTHQVFDIYWLNSRVTNAWCGLLLSVASLCLPRTSLMCDSYLAFCIRGEPNCSYYIVLWLITASKEGTQIIYINFWIVTLRNFIILIARCTYPTALLARDWSSGRQVLLSIWVDIDLWATIHIDRCVAQWCPCVARVKACRSTWKL